MAAIASLVVRVSAQISEFQKSFEDISKASAKTAADLAASSASMSKAVEKIGGEFEKTATAVDGISKKMGASFENIASAATGVAAGMVTAQAAIGAVGAAFGVAQKAIDATFGAIVASVAHTSALGDELFALSQKTGLSVESLSALKFVAAQTNTSLDSITGAVFKLETNLGKGAKSTSEALKGIGLSLKDLQTEDPAKAFSDILLKIGELPNATARAATGVALFGKSFQGIAQLSQEDLPALISKAKELGLVMSTETAVASDRLKDAFGILHGAGQGLQEQLGAKLLPGVVALTEVFSGIWLDALKNAGLSTTALGLNFDNLVVQIGKGATRLVEVLALVAEATAKWVTESVARFKDEANAFLDLVPAFITVGRALDLALSGGTHSEGFDALSKKVESARTSLNSLSTTAVSAGTTLSGLAKSIAGAAGAAGDNFGATFARVQDEIAATADEIRKKLKAGLSGAGSEVATAAKDAFSSFGKQLADLTAQIDRAAKTGTPLSKMVELFGSEAAKSADKARAWGIAVKSSVDAVAQAFNQAALDKTLTKLDDGFAKFFDTRAQQQFKKLQAAMHDSAVAMLELPKTLEKLDDAFTKFFANRSEDTFKKLQAGMHDSVDAVVAGIKPMRDAFEDFGKELPGLIFNGLKSGSVGGFLSVFAQGAAGVLGRALDKQIAALKPGEKLHGGAAAGAVALGGLQSFTSGFQLGEGLGKGKGALAGAATGAAIGANPALSGSTLGISIAVGAGVGALAGFLGGRSADKKAQAALVDNKKALADQFGGMTKLSELATKLGVNIKAAFDTKKPAEFQAIVDKLNTAIEGQNTRLAGLAQALEGVNKRAAAFGAQFQPLVEQKATATKKQQDNPGDATAGVDLKATTQKIQELAQRTQPEFERLGLFVRDTFAGIVKESGNAFDALTQLAPSFETLKSGVTDFGLTSTAVIDSLISSFDLVNNDAFKPLFENIQSTGQLMKGLFDAKALSPETFQASAADIGQSLQEIVNRGGDMSKALALSQPVLQTLWEAQQTYGGITDQTTQSILDQAEKQGLVGEAMKSVNDKILDVLLAIGKVLGADIPDGLRGLVKPAEEAGAGIRTSLGSAFDDVAAKVDPTVGASLRGLRGPATDVGAGISSSLSDAFAGTASKVDPTIGNALRGIVIPAGEAGDEMRKALETQAAVAAEAMRSSLGDALSSTAAASKDAGDSIASNLSDSGYRSAAVIEAKLRNCWLTTEQRAELAALNISASLAKITVPDIKIGVDVKDPPPVKVSFDFDNFDFEGFRKSGSGLDPDKFQTSRATPFAAGGIVRNPTFALIGEAGPEAVVPLSKLSAFATEHVQQSASQAGPTAMAGIGSALFGLVSAARSMAEGVTSALRRIAAPSLSVQVAAADTPRAAAAAHAMAPVTPRTIPALGVPFASMASPQATASQAGDVFNSNRATAQTSVVNVHSIHVAAPRQAALAGLSAAVQGSAPQMASREQTGAVAWSVDHALSSLFAGLRVPASEVRSVQPLSGEPWMAGATPLVGRTVSLNVPHLATGGIAMKRTLAVVGDGGPEAIVPLRHAGHEIGGGTGQPVQLLLDGRVAGEAILPHIARAAKRFGLVPSR